MARETKAERNREILALREQGLTLREIGNRFGIRAETVRQIIVRTERKIRRGSKGQEDRKDVQGAD